MRPITALISIDHLKTAYKSKTIFRTGSKKNFKIEFCHLNHVHKILASPKQFEQIQNTFEPIEGKGTI